MIELLNMDCMDYLRGQPDKSFDLCITSPPYNLGNNHHTGSNRIFHYEDDLPEPVYRKQQIDVLNELRRIIKPEGSLFYNHKNRIKEGLMLSPLEWIFESKWNIKQEIVWRNGSPNFDKIRAFPMTERIYWLGGKNVKMKNESSLTDCMTESLWPPVGTKAYKHGRAFPIQLVNQLLGCFPEAKSMIDPYLGSGSSAIAAHYFGVDFVGIEIDEDYYNAACKRFNEETRQLDLLGET